MCVIVLKRYVEYHRKFLGGRQMKMKKFFAAVLAVVLAVVMVLAVVTGCSKGSGKASADTQKKGMESTFKLKYKDSNGISDITLKSVAAGKEAAISINGSVNVEGESYTVNSDKLLVVSDNKLYVNVKSLLDFIASYGENMGIYGSKIDAVKEYIKEDYVYVDLDSMKDYLKEADSKSVIDTVNGLMDAFKDIAEVSENDTLKQYTVTCKSAEDIVKIAEVLKKYIADNKSAWVDAAYEQYSKIDINDVMDKAADMVVSAMGQDESMSEMLKKQILANVDVSSYEISKEALAESFDKIEEMLDVDASDIKAFNGDATFKITSSGDRTYGISFEANGENGEYAYISYTLNNETLIDASAPDKAQNISDIVSDLVKGLATTK